MILPEPVKGYCKDQLCVVERKVAVRNYARVLWGIVGVGLLTISIAGEVGALEKPVSGDTVVRKTQEAVTATKDYTIQQKDAFQRKIQSELAEMQVGISRLHERVKHMSGEVRTDIKKAIVELEGKSDLAQKKTEDIHSATASSWEQVKSKTAAAVDDLRESLNRAISHLP